jgi:HPt (histidine-containing phosphotransfer) domain-containing protein
MAENKDASKNDSPIDFPSVLERIGGDESFLEELLNLYFEDFSEKYNQLQKAVEGKKFNSIRELGHGLKGSSANLSLNFLREASSQMETSGKEMNIEKAKAALALLEKEFKILKDYLSEKKARF